MADRQEYFRKYNKANRHKRLAWTRLQKYGISQDQLDAMLAAQNEACAICFSTEPGGHGTFHVDHCHETKVVRGLLCHSCNTGLGHFRDDTAALRRAADYLDAARTLH